MDIYVVKVGNYLELVEIYMKGIVKMREIYCLALFYIIEVIQLQGYFIFGFYECYKLKECL